MESDGALDAQVSLATPTKTARAAFAALVDPEAEKVKARKALTASTRKKLSGDLVRRGRDNPRVFRALTVDEKLAALKPPPRPPGLPAFVIAVGGPSKAVLTVALKDADADVRAAAAAPASPFVLAHLKDEPED
jgi:hypothetical protein